MSGLKDMSLMLAAMMEEEFLVDQLKSDIAKYDAAKSKEEKSEAFDRLTMGCTLILSKRVAPDMDAAIRVSKEMEARDRMMGLFQSADDLKN